MLKVVISNTQRDLPLSRQSIRLVVKEILSLYHCATDEVCVHFVSEREICRLHQEYFDDPSPTDCISFPFDQQEKLPFHHLGEVFICPKTALLYVQKKKKNPEVADYYQETTLYLVHALLHLLGYDDRDEKERKKMRRMERKALDHLKTQGLFLTK